MYANDKSHRRELTTKYINDIRDISGSSFCYPTRPADHKQNLVGIYLFKNEIRTQGTRRNDIKE